MKIDWIYSDPHFGHKNIIRFCDRPFADVWEMSRGLIDNYNLAVGTSDTVLWLGDCFFVNPKEAKKILSRLNGHKLLVLGNHDSSAARMAAMGFDLVVDQLVFVAGGHTFRACHYPYADINTTDTRKAELRPTRRGGEVLLHGHTHNVERYSKGAIHCGVDAWDYAPVSMTALCSEIDSGIVRPNKK